MAFCSNCGASVPGDARFCPACGKPAVTAAVQAVPSETPPRENQNSQERYEAPKTTPQNYYAQQQTQTPPQSYYAPQHPQTPPQSYYAQQQNTYAYQQQRPSYQTGQADVEENKGICVLSYLGILFLIPLLTKPNSSYVKFHCNQGLLLCLFAIGVSIVSWIFLYISFVLSAIISWAGWLFVLVLAIMGIVNTVNGQMKQLPLVGKYTLIK